MWVEKPVFRSPHTIPGVCVGEQPPCPSGAGKDHHVCVEMLIFIYSLSLSLSLFLIFDFI